MILDTITKRQSVRRYLPKPVPRPLIEECLEAARLAPSACNSQPWHFIVVDDPALKGQLSREIFSGPYKMNAFAGEAAALVVVVEEPATLMARLGGALQGTAYQILDLGIAAEHFILEAAAQGLGTCWIGWFDERKAKRILTIPRGKKAVAVIALGYPADEPREKIRKPLSQHASFNGYKNT